MGGLGVLSSSMSGECESCRRMAESPSFFDLSGNPNPRDFKILHFEVYGKYIIAQVSYPSCKNYEGIKVLLLECEPSDLVKTNWLDPHFTNENQISPIARFEPSQRGWDLALRSIGASK